MKVYQLLATAIDLAPFIVLAVYIWRECLPKKKVNRRVVAVATRMRTPASVMPPTVYAPENRRVRTLQ